MEDVNSDSAESDYGPLHYTNTPMQYTAIFHGNKKVNFQMKNYNIFLICSKTLIVGTHWNRLNGYTLEPPH